MRYILGMRNEQINPPTEFSQRFAASLNDRRRAGKVTQEAIADKLGVAQSKVSIRLNGRRPVDTDMLDVIAELLGVSVRQMVISILGEMKPTSDRPKAVVSGASVTDPRKQSVKPSLKRR